ncbi:hypothetical protein BGZ95_010317 [Linnemannia exigua]|uniref:F-box domain-containing protein n=1 Tax=Linnemannia exigua TaxID=604196 RepID=A0AAD4DBI7_9FUNG|nr:hypothetical protein BGZ95_010317 [Linnemannia exigua]
MTDGSMDALRGFHRERMASLLRRQQKHLDNLQSETSLIITTTGSSHDGISAMETATTRFKRIPELVLMVLEYSPLSHLPQISLVSKLWSVLAQPLLWRNIHVEDSYQVESMMLSLATHGLWIQSLDFRNFEFRATDFYDSDPRIGSMRSNLYTIDLASILPHTPRLQSIDVRDCNMEQHPLNILSSYPQLESIAFTQYPHHILNNVHDGTADIFTAWPHLKRLCISATSENAVTYALRALENAFRGSKAQHLEIIELDNFPHWLHSTFTVLVSNSADHIVQLSLTNCRIFLTAIENAISSSSQLESLGLHDVSNSPQHLQRILEKHPRLRHLSLTGWMDLLLDKTTLLARTGSQSLVSLNLVDCEMPADAARQFLIQCPHLRRFRLEPLEGPAVMSLFLGEPWKCQGLEEIWLDRIEYMPSEISSTRARDEAIRAMWSQLAALTRMQFLFLKFELPNSSKVLHPKDLKTNKFLKKHEIILDDGRNRLEALKRLKRFGVVGYRMWEFMDVAWLAQSFPKLERFWYDRSDLEVPQWSWLRKELPDVALVPYHKLQL